MCPRIPLNMSWTHGDTAIYVSVELRVRDQVCYLTLRNGKLGERYPKPEDLPTAKQADVYTVGIILFNLITGHDPQLQGNNANIFNSRIENDWRENIFLLEVYKCFGSSYNKRPKITELMDHFYIKDAPKSADREMKAAMGHFMWTRVFHF